MYEAERWVRERLRARGLEPAQLEGLASQLVWRLGRADDGSVTVRVGFATSAALFADLPRLKTATDGELETALREGSLRVEWVGHLPA